MSVYYNLDDDESSELYHYGIMGMKWGLRRYQNSDGSLTTEGKLRYQNTKSVTRDLNRIGVERARIKGDLVRATDKRDKYSSAIASNPKRAAKWNRKVSDLQRLDKQYQKYVDGILKGKGKNVSVRSSKSSTITAHGIDFFKRVFGIIHPLAGIIELTNPELSGLGTGKPGIAEYDSYYSKDFYDSHRESIKKYSDYERSLADRAMAGYRKRHPKY